MLDLVKEPRIVAGIALMLIATLLGGIFLQRASARISVWQIDHDVAVGTVLGPGDVHVAEVAGDVSAYVLASTSVIGNVIGRPLRAGELLPKRVFTDAKSDFDEVMVPATSLHMPDPLAPGELVDVWVSTSDTTTRVLSSARVLRTIAADVGGGRGVALAVPPRATALLIAAIHRGDLDIVRVAA